MSDAEGAIVDLSEADEQLYARIAWHYYVEGMTQSDIGERFGMSRLRINRILFQCRQSGLVQVTINSPFANNIALEQDLKRIFALKRAIVVPTPNKDGDLNDVVGHAAGTYLSEIISNNHVIGVGWGVTLSRAMRAIRRKTLHGASVVSLCGGLTRSSAMNPHEIASRMARLMGAKCYWLAAPAYMETREGRDSLMEHGVIQDVLARANAADVAFVSAGELGPESTLRNVNLVSDQDIESLRASGAVGDVLGHFLDRHGNRIRHPVNDRLMAITLDGFKGIPERILVSGGYKKLDIISAALSIGLSSTFVTDERTAEAILDRLERERTQGRS